MAIEGRTSRRAVDSHYQSVRNAVESTLSGVAKIHGLKTEENRTMTQQLARVAKVSGTYHEFLENASIVFNSNGVSGEKFGYTFRFMKKKGDEDLYNTSGTDVGRHISAKTLRDASKEGLPDMHAIVEHIAKDTGATAKDRPALRHMLMFYHLANNENKALVNALCGARK